jgi:hypothetical protein
MRFDEFSNPFDEKKLSEVAKNMTPKEKEKFLEDYATNFLKIANFRRGIQTPAIIIPDSDFYTEEFTIKQIPELDFIDKLTADEIIAQIYLPNQPLLS